jgi:CheY-like chemotaxis protein
MMLRPDIPNPQSDAAMARTSAAMVQEAAAELRGGKATQPRLNMLLSSAHWRHEPTLEQLPRLLAPMGIHSITTSSGEEATEVIRTVRVHIAVVDVSIPMQRCGTTESGQMFDRTCAGPRVLQLLRRLEQPPPTVVVRPPQPAVRDSARSLMEALREGAFAVLDQPVPLEAMLEVLRRILRRHYADAWPV